MATGVFVYRKFAGGDPQQVRPPAPPSTMAPVRARNRAAATAGTLRIVSTPPGATVTLDGQPRGITPADLADVPFGTHEVKVELRGYAPATERVMVSADNAAPALTLALSRTAPPTGMAEITSDPPGATVRIDGTPVGQTPLSDPKMRTGSRRVEMTRDGFQPWSGTINVQAGKRARVDARLRPVVVAAPPPTAAPDVVDVNRIYVNSPTEVDVPAQRISGASAAYPSGRASRLKSGQSVSVRLGFIVNEDGSVTDVRVVESAGRLVDEAVLKAVRTWKYSPAVKKGTKVKVRVDFRQTFRAS
jgi:TonB family protein